MKSRELKNLGLTSAEVKLAKRLVVTAGREGRLAKKDMRERIQAVVDAPTSNLQDPWFGELALALSSPRAVFGEHAFVERDAPAPWRVWGEGIDEKAIDQMRNACRLPVAHAGALMPDAHLGYGLPIGGVLATRNAVIPYAVGVDIACRMRLTVLDIPPDTALKGEKQRLINILEEETRFGIGANFAHPHDHEVLDEDWNQLEVLKRVKDKARKQLGSSGSGNHFVEYGTLTLDDDSPALGLSSGNYLALLSHSGSRGAGATVAGHYSKLAQSLHPELPKELKHLAWLDMDSAEGQEYWAAMNLMGRYAAANHEVIHREIVRALKSKPLAGLENHHNFCWVEKHDGEDLYVHRKGATPAGQGVLGIIPGSMATPAYVVAGRGEPESLRSAAHGAGRLMSRRAAKAKFTWSDVKKLLAERDVTLLSSGIDEVPGVYKDINEVMSYQRDLVDIIARFQPRIVKMAPPGEPPED